MDSLINSRRTGNAQSFARKLGLSISQTKEEIRQMRALGARIRFDRFKNSYVYYQNSSLTFSLNITSQPEYKDNQSSNQ